MTLARWNLDVDVAPSVGTLRPEVEETLRTVLGTYHIPELDAENLLRETVIEVLYKAEDPTDFSMRIRPVLQAKCRTYWATRRWRSSGEAPNSLPTPQRPPREDGRRPQVHHWYYDGHGAVATSPVRRWMNALRWW